MASFLVVPDTGNYWTDWAYQLLSAGQESDLRLRPPGQHSGADKPHRLSSLSRGLLSPPALWVLRGVGSAPWLLPLLVARRPFRDRTTRPSGRPGFARPRTACHVIGPVVSRRVCRTSSGVDGRPEGCPHRLPCLASPSASGPRGVL